MSLPLGQEPQSSGQEPVPAPQAPPAPTQTPPAGQEPTKTVFDADYVAELRKEAAANRKKAAELEAKLKEHEDEKLGETERLAKRLADTEAALQQERTARAEAALRIEVERQARRLEVVDEEAAYVLLDKAGLGESDDLPKAVEKRLKALIDGKPWLVKTHANGAAGPNPTPRPSGPESKEQRAQALYEGMRSGFPRV